MTRPRGTPSADESGGDEFEAGRSGQLAFGRWWLLYNGPIGPMAPHAHHAFQILVHSGTPCVADGHHELVPGPIVLIDPYQSHAFVERRDSVLVAFIDPDSTAGDFLSSHRAISKGPANVVSALSLIESASGTWGQAEETVRRMLTAVCEPSVRSSIESIRDSPIDMQSIGKTRRQDGSLDMEGTSGSHVARQSDSEEGTPVHSAGRWMRLMTAIGMVRLGLTSTDAAHASGFADAAHFAGTFNSIFGFGPLGAVEVGVWLWP